MGFHRTAYDIVCPDKILNRIMVSQTSSEIDENDRHFKKSITES